MKKSFTSIILCVFLYSNALLASSSGTEACKTIYVVKREWHTSIVFLRNDFIRYSKKLQKEFENYRYIEISWGDEDYFIADKPTIFQGIKAIFFPTRSVILIEAYHTSPLMIYSIGNCYEFKLVESSFNALVEYIDHSFATQNYQPTQLIPIGKCTEYSCFYRSNEKYHAFKTCNVWLAKAFKKSGFKICLARTILPQGTIKQLLKNYRLQKGNLFCQ